MGKTVIFLDIDGVLNSYGCEDKIGHIIGVEDEKIGYLKEIVDFLDAEIVLSSSWRAYWKKELLSDGVRSWKGNTPFRYGRYLNLKLEKYGLKISDKTIDLHWRNRALEILNYLENNPDIDRFIILDDEDFFWSRYQLDKHWVSTFRWNMVMFDEGLTPDIVEYIKNNTFKFERTK